MHFWGHWNQSSLTANNLVICNAVLKTWDDDGQAIFMPCSCRFCEFNFNPEFLKSFSSSKTLLFRVCEKVFHKKVLETKMTPVPQQSSSSPNNLQQKDSAKVPDQPSSSQGTPPTNSSPSNSSPATPHVKKPFIKSSRAPYKPRKPPVDGGPRGSPSSAAAGNTARKFNPYNPMNDRYCATCGGIVFGQVHKHLGNYSFKWIVNCKA